LHNLTDRALKERVIGAAVLVIFAVLVVPVFLDGQSGEPEVISESVSLPGQNDTDRKQQTIVLDRNRSQPVPASRTPTPAREEHDEPVASAPAEQPAPKAEVAQDIPVTPPSVDTGQSETGMWAVQLGSFSNKENAERLAADLRNQGFAAFLSQLQTDSGALQRVRIGPQKDRASAEAIATQLANAGHNGRVVPHP
jgi:DedD protein